MYFTLFPHFAVEAEDSVLHDELLKNDACTPKTTDCTENENQFVDSIADTEADEPAAPKNPEENEKEDKDKESGDNETTEKRPSSRESSTSTTSSSSERITIRSTSQLNQLVPSNTDVIIKTEKDTTTDKVEKPGLSVLNPSQLGASENTSGGNLLQNNNFVSSGDQMMGFLPSGMSTPTQVRLVRYRCHQTASKTKYYSLV